LSLPRNSAQRAVEAKSQPQPQPIATEKLQKVLARVGVGSRRQIEQWIAEGRITVNGEPATLGQRVTAHDRVTLDGRVIPTAGITPKSRVLVYHKPEGEVCTRSDPQGRPTVFEHLPTLRASRWILVGRLDFSTSGLLVVTNDGELAHRLMHPSSEIEREYAVRIFGEVTPQMLEQLRQGVQLEDGLARFDDIIDAGGSGMNRWYHVTLREGRYREVRRMWEAVGANLSRLIRVRFGNVTLPRHVRPGRFEDLEPEAAAELYRLAGLTPPAATRAPTLVRPRAPKGERAAPRRVGGGPARDRPRPHGGPRGRAGRGRR
jgi:23S rRNA pseudouridine2605 synthase